MELEMTGIDHLNGNGLRTARLTRVDRIHIPGVLNPIALGRLTQHPKVLRGYTEIFWSYRDGHLVATLQGISDLLAIVSENSLNLPRELKTTFLAMLNSIKGGRFDKLVEESKEDFSYVGILMELKDGHILLLLSGFVESGEKFEPEQKSKIASLYERVGQWFLNDREIEDPLAQVISIIDPFYFGIYDLRISNIILTVVKRLFADGTHESSILAVSHCFEMWRFTSRANDPVAREINARIKGALLSGFGNVEGLKEAAGKVERAPVMVEDLIFGIRKQVSEIVSRTMAFGVPIRKAHDAVIRELLDKALEEHVSLRAGILDKIEKLISSRLSLRAPGAMSEPTHFGKLRLLRELCRDFENERYRKIDGLRDLELRLLGGIMYPLRAEKKEEALKEIFFHMIESAGKGDVYLVSRLFEIPELDRKEFKRRFFKVFSKAFYGYLGALNTNKLKILMRSVNDRVFAFCLGMVDAVAITLCKEDNADAALEVYRRFGEDEAEGSVLFQNYLLGTAVIYAEAKKEIEKAMEYFGKIIETNRGEGKLAFFLARAHFNLGNIYLEAKKRNEAKFHLEKSVEHLKEGMPFVASDIFLQHLNNLGAIYLELEENLEARDVLSKALNYAGSDFLHYFNFIIACWKAGEYDRAFDTVKDFMGKHGGDRKAMEDTRIYSTIIELYIRFNETGLTEKRDEAMGILVGLKTKRPDAKGLISNAIRELENDEDGEKIAVPREIKDILKDD